MKTKLESELNEINSKKSEAQQKITHLEEKKSDEILNASQAKIDRFNGQSVSRASAGPLKCDSGTMKNFEFAIDHLDDEILLSQGEIVLGQSKTENQLKPSLQYKVLEKQKNEIQIRESVCKLIRNQALLDRAQKQSNKQVVNQLASRSSEILAEHKSLKAKNQVLASEIQSLKTQIEKETKTPTANQPKFVSLNKKKSIWQKVFGRSSSNEDNSEAPTNSAMSAK
jgi:hypothetical protein